MDLKFNINQRGFTLVEVLVVMLILVALASVTLDFTKDFAFQGRYEVTKDRYDKIKRAIIGRPDVLINGQPDISGFVADVGRLPENLHELMEESFCPQRWKFVAGSKVYYEIPALCAADGLMWTAPIAGWKGPYLTTTNNPLHDNAFSDGWGNQDSTLNAFCTDPAQPDETACGLAGATWYEGAAGQNYGWEFCLGDAPDIATNTCTGTNQLAIQSRGKNQAVGGTENYDLDYPRSITATNPSIALSDWTVNIDNLTSTVLSEFNGSCNVTNAYKNVCQSFLGEWNNGKCDIKKGYLCEAVLGGTWSKPPSGPSNCLVSTTNTETDCTTASSGVWDSATKYCTTSIDTPSKCTSLGGAWTTSCNITKAIITKNKLCEFLGGNWISGTQTCEHSAKTLCQGNGGLWDVTKKTVHLKVNGELSSNSPQVSEDGHSQLLKFNFATPTIPMGQVSIGIYYASDTDLTYPGLCTDTNNDVQFIESTCTANSGIWHDDGSMKYCSRMISAVACITTLGGTLKPENILKLSPHTTEPNFNW